MGPLLSSHPVETSQKIFERLGSDFKKISLNFFS